jgi:hypothetical protein
MKPLIDSKALFNCGSQGYGIISGEGEDLESKINPAAGQSDLGSPTTT